MLTFLVLLVLLTLVSGKYIQFNKIFVEFGNNIGKHVPMQLITHLKSGGIPILLNSSDAAKDAHSLTLSFGNTPNCLTIIEADFLNSLPDESFVVRSFKNEMGLYIYGNGLPLSGLIGGNSSLDRKNIHYGAVLASYNILELLGFAFLHPLSPTYPSIIQISEEVIVKGINIVESPHWPHRAFHLHTQHPLEINEVLQGFDIPQAGPFGSSCSAFSYSAKFRNIPHKFPFHLEYQKVLDQYERIHAFSANDKLSKVNMSSLFASYLTYRGFHSETDIERLSQESGTDFAESWDKFLKALSLDWQDLLSEQDGKMDFHSLNFLYDQLRGFDTVDNSKEEEYCEQWEDMVNEVNSLFEWSIVNRLNKIEWLLLGNYNNWDAHLSTRQHRLSLLVDLGHQYSLLIGANSPLGNVQQHGWFMADTSSSYARQVAQIRNQVDWVFEAGFDFLTTESGSSEFTHPECNLMLDLMNEYATYVSQTWGRESGIKVHCSTGQICKEFPDPRTGEPINFNFLSTYAVGDLGVFPHTIQVYGLDDPTAGVYGNENFSHIEDYLVYESKRKAVTNRTVLFYGETAYWVNADIDVPLFLPLFGERRLRDLRRIAQREITEGFRMDGQMNFDSGWEWGYWLNDVITARASWNPLLTEVPLETVSINGISTASSWKAFQVSLNPILRIFPAHIATRLSDLLVNLTMLEEQLFVFGSVKSEVFAKVRSNNSEIIKNIDRSQLEFSSSNLFKRSGLAYLEGDDTWIDLPRMIGIKSLFQPDKVHLNENDDVLWNDVLQLLEALEVNIFPVYEEAQKLAADSYFEMVKTEYCAGASTNELCATIHEDLTVNHMSLSIIDEVYDCIALLYLRIKQVLLLYRSRDATTPHEVAAEYQTQSRSVIHAASYIVRARERMYRVPVQRIAEWRENPTVYRYGYLWSVHSLYYWWRDQGIAEAGSTQSAYSPCYLNRMDATQVAVGFGRFTLAFLRAFVNKYSPFALGFPLELVNCFAPPPREYEFPRDLYHYE